MLKLLIFLLLLIIVINSKNIRARYPQIYSNKNQQEQQYYYYYQQQQKNDDENLYKKPKFQTKQVESSLLYPSNLIDNNNLLDGKTIRIIAPEYQYRKGAVRRKPHSSRYQNIFSNTRYLSSLPFQVIPGSEFTPRETLEPYTNRLYGGRRELYKWSPPSNILESTYITF